MVWLEVGLYHPGLRYPIGYLGLVGLLLRGCGRILSGNLWHLAAKGRVIFQNSRLALAGRKPETLSGWRRTH